MPDRGLCLWPSPLSRCPLSGGGRAPARNRAASAKKGAFWHCSCFSAQNGCCGSGWRSTADTALRAPRAQERMAVMTSWDARHARGVLEGPPTSRRTNGGGPLSGVGAPQGHVGGAEWGRGSRAGPAAPGHPPSVYSVPGSALDFPSRLATYCLLSQAEHNRPHL